MLKLCPTCQYHKPTRGTHQVCAQCRRNARVNEQLRRLTVRQRTHITKLRQVGYSPARALHIARAFA